MKKLTEHTIEELNYLQAPVYSPDGKWIAFTASKLDYQNNCYINNLYLIHDGKTEKAEIEGNVKSFAWTPEGNIIFPSAQTEEEKSALSEGKRLTFYYEYSPETKAQRRLFTVPLASSNKFAVLSNGCLVIMAECILCAETEEEYQAAMKREEIYYSFEELPFWKLNNGVQGGRRNYLYLYDPETSNIKQINRKLENVIRFSASENWVVYSATEHVSDVESWDVSINTFNAETGMMYCVMPTGMLICRNHEVYGTIWNDKVLIMGSEGKIHGRTESPAMWMTGLTGGGMHLFDVPEYNIGYRNIMTDFTSAGGMLKPAGDRLYYTVTKAYNTYIQYCDTNGKRSEFLTPDGSIEGFDVHGDNICYCGMYGNGMMEVYENGQQLTHLNSALLEYSLSTPEHLSFTNKSGYTIDGWVMKPIDYEPSKKYPGLLSIHGGPRCSFGSVFYHEHQLYANDGYFVFFCNPRGSEGYGDDFADVWGKIGTIDYDDLMEFTDVVLDRFEDIDKERVGVMGGSYGGTMTNWIIGHTDRFKAACSMRSMSNWISFEYATAQGYTWTPNFAHLRSIEGDSEKAWSMSPLKYARNAKTPTLFIVADQDNESWMVEGIQMFTALKLVGTPAKLLLFRNEGHGLSREGRPLGRIARLTEIHDWMNGYLK